MAELKILPAIMSGGAGTRLWPTSTDAAPKQFHAFGGDRSLIVETVSRLTGTHAGLRFLPPMILCNFAHTKLTLTQLAPIGPSALVVEPEPRNTAAVGAIAAAVGREIDPDALVLLAPADHLITDIAAFHAAIARAAPIARTRIVTFGIHPSRPDTGYGYIKSGGALADGVYEIDSFKEKPSADVAAQYLSDGGYSWNAGMFLFSPAIMLQEFAKSADIRDGALAALANAQRDGIMINLDPQIFSAIRKEPLDIAVMEKTALGAVAPCDIGWVDIGAWDEVWRLAEKDDAENAMFGRVGAISAQRNLLRSEGPKLCVLGVEDLIVIATADAVIVVPRKLAQEVKALHALARDL